MQDNLSLHQNHKPGQSFLEYALLIALLVVIVLTVLALTGQLTGQKLTLNLTTTPNNSATIGPTATSSVPTNTDILADTTSRILAYYQAHHSWPRTWSPYNYTDVGLNPSDYTSAINGLYWSPHGSNIGISNKAGDQYQVYVKSTNGTMLHLVDGWAIWCDVATSVCYYHTIAPGNEVDFSSIVVTTN